ncbi:hypothetical protein [Parabacteroides goldsteinii]|uniref:hypothetical protein n=1 Tax=Parabacteroides goldsteinii TaxID=328812 RepID=UPI003AB6B027
MRYFVRDIWYPVLPILFALILTCSCSDEQERLLVPDGERVKIGLNLRSIGTVDGEDRINSVRILQVSLTGEILTNTFIADIQTNPFTVELMSGQSEVHVVVNESQSIGTENANMAAITTYNDLKSMALGPYMHSNDPFYGNIPMLGSVMDVRISPSLAGSPGTVSVNGGAPGCVLKVSLERLVCKVELRTKLTVNGALIPPSDFLVGRTMSFQLVPGMIPLFDDYTGATLKNFKSLLLSNFVRSGDYYVYRDPDGKPLYLSSNLFNPCNNRNNASLVQTMLLGDEAINIPIGHNIDPAQGAIDYTLHRNYSYVLTLTSVNDEQKIKMEVEKKWYHENVDAPVYGEMLQVPDSVIMDADRWGGSKKVQVYCSARHSQAPDDYYYPIKVLVGGVEQPVVVSGGNVELPDLPDWLTAASVRLYFPYNPDPEKWVELACFNFTYQETTGPYPDYVITLKFGNIVKEMRVVYGKK